jgi:hypothetical protein
MKKPHDLKSMSADELWSLHELGLSKYINPAQPSETWAGRGKQPRWLAAQLKSGKRSDDFRIDLEAATGVE